MRISAVTGFAVVSLFVLFTGTQLEAADRVVVLEYFTSTY